MAVRLILDTDIGSDVDDALALVFAVRHPDIELDAVTTVADDTIARAHIATKLLRIAGRDDIEVAPGVGWTQPRAGRRSWFGHEGKGLIENDDIFPIYGRDAVTLLLERSGADIATVGMQSNIAAAVEADDGFPARVPRLHVMGGAFGPVAGRDVEGEHNLTTDPEASARALNAGFRVRYTPLDVTVHAPVRRAHLERLRTGDEVCRALARMIDIWAGFAKYPGDVVALLHDPLAVACAVDTRFVTIEELPVRLAVVDGVAKTLVDEVHGRPAEVLTSVDGAVFADFWLETVLG